MVEGGGRGAAGTLRRGLCAIALAASVMGCMMGDPMDPRRELDHRAVKSFEDAERTARSRPAFERARQRLDGVQHGMNVAEVEHVMGAIVVAERHGEEKETEAARKKLIEGLLCRRQPSSLRQRWLFGYDDDGVELVGFVLEFERDDPDKERWTVRAVDRNPSDDCPETDQ